MSRLSHCCLALTLAAVLAWATLALGHNVGDPVQASHTNPPATRVRVASTGNVTISGPGSAIDGVSLSSGDRVLLWAQTTGTENGIYLWNGAASAMTRATDFDAAGEFLFGQPVIVSEGDTYAGAIFIFLNTATPTLGTTTLTYQAVRPACDTTDNPACIDGSGVLNSWSTRLSEHVVTCAGTAACAAAGACGDVRELRVDTTNLGDVYVCPNGSGSNPVISHARSTAYQVAATDCTALTGFPAGTGCYQMSDNTLWICEPTAGDCDTAGEWVQPSAAAGGTTKTLWLPAASLSASGNCSDASEVTLATNSLKTWAIQCSDSDTGSLEFTWTFTAADNWDQGTFTFQFVVFSTGNNSTEVLAIDFAATCVRDGDPLPTHSTTGEQEAQVVFAAQAADLQISAASNPVTPNGSCADTATIVARGQIDAGTSTLNPFTDAFILGIKVTYGTD